MVRKDEVVDWFHKLNGAGRLDVMCTLLDECLPFELRFLGTVMENLGRRDFHELRDVDHRANTFLHPNSSLAEVSDNVTLSSTRMDSSHQQLSNTSISNLHPSSFTGTPAAFNNVPDDYHQKAPENTSPASRPNSVQHTDKVRSSGISGGSPQSQQSNLVPEGQFIGERHQGDRFDSGSKPAVLNLPVNSSNESADEKSDKSILLDDIVRRRLILYLSLLTATNRECANGYYKVLSEVEPLVELNGWLESVESHMLEEMALLYTIASNHPAFTFKQRSAMNEVCNKFCNQQSKLETPKVFTQATQSFIATAVHGFDPKFGQYYIHYVPHPVQAMQWQSPNATGNIIGSNGTAEEGNRLQSPVTFAMPTYHPFPAMYMPSHLPRSQAPPIHHTQVQVPHQFSQNLPVQSAVSPQGTQLGINSQPPTHPTQNVQHSYQQNPQVQGSTASHNQIHAQPPPHVPHSYSSTMNGLVQNILPVSTGIHAQMQPVGLSNASSIASTLPQYQPKAQNVSQLSPQLPAQAPSINSLLVGGTNNVTAAAFPCQSNSLDGNESEECCWDSPESSSPFQSPPQSLTPSRNHSPTPLNNQAHVINQNPSFVNVPPVVSHLRANQEMNNHSSAAPVVASPTAFSSSSQRSVSSSTTSISPPPRSQKASSSQKHSQNVQVQARILPKNAQDMEVNMGGLNNVNQPYSSVAVYTPSVSMTKSSNCIAGPNNLNGFKSMPDRRSTSNSKVYMPNLMNNCNINSSSNVSTSLTVSQSQGVMKPVVAVVSSANYALSAPHLVPASSSSMQQQQQHQQHQLQQQQLQQQQLQQSQQHQPQPQRETNRRQQQPNRRQQANNSASHQQSHHTPSSASNHYIHSHSQPMKNTNIATSAHNLSQYSFTFPFSIPSYAPQPQQPTIAPSKATNTISHQFTNPASKQQVPSQTVLPTNQSGKVPNPEMPVVFTGHPQQSNSSHNHNGIKLSAQDCASSFNLPTALPSNLTIIDSTPTALQHPASSAVHPSQSSRSRVLLEVGGGQDAVGMGRLDGIQFLEDLADDSSRSKTSCYNCGAQTHVGPECKENTMEEMTKHPYRINFHPEVSQETKDTE